MTLEDYERLGKLTAYFIAAIYVVGVGVVNLRLAQFGITGMGLLREQYIFAGTWAILPVLAISVIVGTFCGFVIQMFRYHQLVEARPRPEPDVAYSALEGGTHKAGRHVWTNVRNTVERATPAVTATVRAAWTTAFWTVLVAFVFSYAVNSAVPAATARVTTLDVLVTGGKIALFTVGIGCCGAFAVQIVRGPKDTWSYVLAAAVALTTAILVLGYLSFFALSIYAKIPAGIGGGADTNVRLLLDLDPTRTTQLGIRNDGGTPLRLLFVTNNTYYVISPRDSTRALGIPSTAILGMETLR
jgi:hypothetical protein